MPLYVLTLLCSGPVDEVRDVSAAHRDHLAELRGQGKLRFAVELAHGEGFVEVLDVADRREAEASAHAAPLVEAGLAAWMLRECREVETGGN